jgi:hypothetical protein
MEFRITIDGTSPLAKLHEKAAQSFIQNAAEPDESSEHATHLVRHPTLHCA